MKKKTQELLKLLEKSDAIDTYLTENSDDIIFDDVSGLLEAFLSAKNMQKSEVIRRAQIDRTYGYQIFDGKKNPSRDKLIMMSFGLGLSVDEAQQILKKTGNGLLYPRDLRDSVIIFALSHKLSVIETNEILYEKRLKILE